MKIGINGRFYAAPLTGVQRFSRELSARIYDRQGGVLFLPRGTDPPPGLPERVEVVVGRTRGHRWEQLELPGAAAACDVLLHPANTCPLRGAGHVVVVHDVLPLSHPAWFDRRFASWYRWVVKRAVRGAEQVLTVSQWSADQLIRLVGVDPDRVEIVTQGIEPFHQPASAAVVGRVRERWSLPPEYVLTVDGGDPRKNLIFLTGVLDDLASKSDRTLPLVVVGRSRHVHRSPPSIELASKHVVDVGSVTDEDLHGLYTGATVFCFPSLAEGFGRPPLEAVACGTPAVVAEYGPAREVMGDGAEILPLDRAAWTATLDDLLSDADRRRDLAERGRQVAARYRWGRTCDQVLEACGKVARRTARVGAP